ncbi:MAG: RluA family pseudouridine synthase [Eubacterium sp.]|nr:RluA family pseudouridine synthase [Eubacterium sp.]MCM1216693.1 RluA family pseudouridine synthase [Lachnospiraceae bacterium]MCM1240383.1 RluA family pseudouridine synthase [Lachnospiraceae bacterium]
MRTKIIYEDNALLVVQKPAGLATQTARAGQADVVSELKNHLKDPYLGVVHRLDQPVEGLLVFARNREAAAVLSAQLADGTLNKRYHAVICGRPASEQGELVDHLYKDARNGGHAVVVEEWERPRFPEAKKAVLQYRLAQYAEVPDLSLMEIHIDTGRFHQIRAQMAHAGMALLGDARYGDETARERGRDMNVRNVALCAYELTFEHPVKKREMCFQIRPEGKAFAYFKDFLPY